jgi:hypothetical protein
MFKLFKLKPAPPRAAIPRLTRCVFVLAAAPLFLSAAVGDVEWYISNSSGMALEKTFKSRAIREKYSLQVLYVEPSAIPRELRKFYSTSWQIECRVLYEEGRRARTQWTFWDSAQTAYFVAAIGNDGAGFIEWYNETGHIVEEQRLDPDGGGYYINYHYKDAYLLRAKATAIEPYQKKPLPASPSQGPLQGETSAAPPEGAKEAAEKDGGAATDSAAPEDDEAAAMADDDAPGDDEADAVAGITPPPAAPQPPAPQPSAGAGTLAKEAAETPPDPPLPAAARARSPESARDFPAAFVARAGREGAALWEDTYRYARGKTIRSIERRVLSEAGKQELVKMKIPRTVEKETDENTFVQPATSFMSDFLSDVIYNKTSRITYTTDKKRRVISEAFFNETGGKIGEMRNTWSEDRLVSVEWDGGEDTRRVDYTYNKAGDRVTESDYHNGVLERTVSVEGKQEIERIYKYGSLILQAVWEDGRKLSERRIWEGAGVR